MTKPEHSTRGGPAVPSRWVRRFLPLIRPGGRVLDLAAGGGRHSRLLRAHGYRVVAVDRDVAGLAELAADAGCEVVALDLEDGRPWSLGGGYDGIIATNYLHRPLFPDLVRALAADGVLVYETFAVGNERFGKPSDPAFLLRPGELLEAFGSILTVIAFEQGVAAEPRPAAIQRIAAINSAARESLPPLPPAGAN
ncbi:MAG TPA: methyltransferase domain-containing protein [Stellaceae bacterium]|nr:methyltransferase domain-containing protein [Stellaceae bacterium]